MLLLPGEQTGPGQSILHIGYDVTIIGIEDGRPGDKHHPHLSLIQSIDQFPADFPEQTFRPVALHRVPDPLAGNNSYTQRIDTIFEMTTVSVIAITDQSRCPSVAAQFVFIFEIKHYRRRATDLLSVLVYMPELPAPAKYVHGSPLDSRRSGRTGGGGRTPARRARSLFEYYAETVRRFLPFLRLRFKMSRPLLVLMRFLKPWSRSLLVFRG